MLVFFIGGLVSGEELFEVLVKLLIFDELLDKVKNLLEEFWSLFLVFELQEVALAMSLKGDWEVFREGSVKMRQVIGIQIGESFHNWMHKL